MQLVEAGTQIYPVHFSYFNLVITNIYNVLLFGDLKYGENLDS